MLGDRNQTSAEFTSVSGAANNMASGFGASVSGGFSTRPAEAADTVKRRLQDCDAALALDDGPIFSTVAQLVEALKRSIPEGTETARSASKMRPGSELLRGNKYEET